jgi:hypothetical protein
MNKNSPDTYVKNPYVINVRKCYNDLKERTQQVNIDNERKQIVIEILDHEFQFFCSQIIIKEDLNYSDDNKQYELSTSHVSFYKWLAYDLTLQNHTTIQSMLTAYSVGTLGSVVNFNNEIEFMIPKYMSHLIFNHKEQDYAVQHWIKENNYRIDLYANKENSELFFSESIEPKIKIAPEAQSFLKTNLIKYLGSDSQRTLFLGAMEGLYLKDNEKVFLDLRANVFCDLIKQLRDDRELLITSNKTQINKWICNNFLFNLKGSPAPIKKSYCTQLLSGREEPSKANRFSIKDLIVK